MSSLCQKKSCNIITGKSFCEIHCCKNPVCLNIRNLEKKRTHRDVSFAYCGKCIIPTCKFSSCENKCFDELTEPKELNNYEYCFDHQPTYCFTMNCRNIIYDIIYDAYSCRIYKHCQDHKCEFKKCDLARIIPDNKCEKHTEEYCTLRISNKMCGKLKDSKTLPCCNDHFCKVSGCNLMMENDKLYCKKHICRYHECTDLGKLHGLCPTHQKICRYSKKREGIVCTNAVEIGQIFCLDHNPI